MTNEETFEMTNEETIELLMKQIKALNQELKSAPNSQWAESITEDITYYQNQIDFITQER